MSRGNVIFISKSSQKKVMSIIIFGGVCMRNNRSQYTKECEIEAARLNSRVMQTHLYLGYLSHDEFEKKNVA